MTPLRVARLLERSRANGPGERCVVWVQGCALGCRGCFNPELWTRQGGVEIPPGELAARINAIEGLRGVTLSGGEPLEQPEAVGELLSLLDGRLDAVLFTGFSWEEVLADPRRRAAALKADLVVAGRYERELASSANPWAGSSNKGVFALTGRLRPEEAPECRVEVQVSSDGSVFVTGFPDPGLLSALKSLA